MPLRFLQRLLAIFMSALLSGALVHSTASAQEEQPGSARKIITRTVPVCPDLARRMNLQGTVKLLVTVEPDGTVKSAEVVGGHPLLVSAAENAVHKWKWVSEKAESKELVEIKFQRK